MISYLHVDKLPIICALYDTQNEAKPKNWKKWQKPNEEAKEDGIRREGTKIPKTTV